MLYVPVIHAVECVYAILDFFDINFPVLWLGDVYSLFLHVFYDNVLAVCFVYRGRQNDAFTRCGQSAGFAISCRCLHHGCLVQLFCPALVAKAVGSCHSIIGGCVASPCRQLPSGGSCQYQVAGIMDVHRIFFARVYIIIYRGSLDGGSVLVLQAVVPSQRGGFFILFYAECNRLLWSLVALPCHGRHKGRVAVEFGSNEIV